ncbi:group I intron-associated PD-(D/E)XK endonuclease [Haloarchaeobius amylolyticus]|uniref:group I intron-associated PD-(D/E)XK endonuclease n=1 Tax=Haloarchaeobius amylolyticus TaxID=1198296 RepID=UPI00226FEABA|nr:group I intron-associated PD-(D/E)XK endonuclease [Haloarchaeobius amylolyticus]
MDPHRKGDLTEALVIAEFKRRAIPIATSVGDNERWDVLAETETGAILRVQIKTGWIENGTIRLVGTTVHTNSTGNVRKRYHGDVDVFVVYCHENETMYLVEEREFGTQIRLRVDEPAIRHKNINWAEEYEFDERWPPDLDTNARTLQTTDPTTVAGVDALESAGAPVWRDVRGTSKRNVVTVVDGRPYRVRIESGFLREGRIKVHPDETDTDCYVVYCDDLDDCDDVAAVYAIAREEVAETFSLRMDEPERIRANTKLATDYAFATNWPPA